MPSNLEVKKVMQDITITFPDSVADATVNAAPDAINPAVTGTAAITESSSDFADFVMRRLRYARIQARLVLNQLNTVGVALNAGWIDGEGALAMLHEAGLLPLVEGSS
jgi:hypothetical protein